MPHYMRLGRQADTVFSPAVYPQRLHRFAREDSRSADRSPQAEGPVLVVEDDFLVAMQIEATLTEAGFALAGVAASGEEAIDLAGSIRPALALMDIRLAGKMDGVAPPAPGTRMVTVLRENKPTRVAVTTGITDGSSTEVVSGLEVNDVVITDKAGATGGQGGGRPPGVGRMF